MFKSHTGTTCRSRYITHYTVILECNMKVHAHDWVTITSEGYSTSITLKNIKKTNIMLETFTLHNSYGYSEVIYVIDYHLITRTYIHIFVYHCTHVPYRY